MASLLPPSPHEAHAPPLSDSARLYLARSRSHTSQQRDLPEAKRSRGVSPSQRPHLARSSSSSRRTAAVNSSVHDWVGGVAAARPNTPAQQACPYPDADSSRLYVHAERAEWAAPSAPALDVHGEHYATPESSPEGVDDVARVAGPSRAATLPSLAGRSSFVKRDDLTAKAVARAASFSTAAGLERHRQDSVSSSSVPALPQQGHDKDRFVNGLVGASVLAIESIWGPSSPSSSASPPPSSMSGASNPGVLPLQWFVKEVLRRSRTSCSTLQLALYYLHKSRREIRDAVARADVSRGEIVRLEQELKAVKARTGASASSAASYPSPPRSPSDELDVAHAVHASALASELGERFSQLVEAQNSPVLCGRRMFLAALISASKYLQDRNYSNRAWAKISGLAVGEINSNERAFLQVVQFQLHLRAEDFQRWTERLATLSSSSLHASPDARQGLARSASESLVLAEPLAAQLVAGARTHGTVTSAARTALSRGHSAAAVLSGVRDRGFPIAQPMAYREPAGSDHPSSAADEPRKVRALPTRRSRASLVPATWAAGAPMDGVVLTGAARRIDAVAAH